MVKSALLNLQNYVHGGFLNTAGFYTLAPEYGEGFSDWSDTRHTKWGNTKWDISRGTGLGGPPSFPRGRGKVGDPGIGKTLGSLFGPALSGYFMYRGWTGADGGEGGVVGAKDALAYDIGVMSGMQRWSHVRQAGGGKHGGKVGQFRYRSRGMPGSIGVMLGAGIGANLGQSVLGTPGSLMGGYVGGAMGAATIGSGSWLAAGPRALAAGAVIGGAVLVGKGAFSLVKTGYRRGAARHSIDTAGDTSAFMTRNAMTMRARSVEAMRNSHMNARQSLGMEATYLHSSRNYFSNYR